ncbi:WavE lipopolysaccharide synthesis family protein [Marinobacter shengliensis]|uniref:WavE lipopolysaccharide synthesis family protein n=1 Tax=Marinobacter shengliensis TaxID=1389223 RepID=UPI001E516EEC|nr:WavE lipopolysaccharide synthesis family protein [Marinobacter shengliensis]MCD1631090.1 WavE lipopolysaccharide synthesis family protein [Marinobacter shengliensis]
MIDYKDITVVVQGPVQTFQDREQEPGITRKCLESVRKHLPGSTVILSTWPNQDLEGLDYDELVISEDPGPNIRYFKRDGTPQRFNNNRQIVSSREGLKHVSTRYAVKLRSDNFLTGSQFVDLQKKFPIRSQQYKFFDERVVVSNVFTRKYAKGYPVAFHLSDFFYFGLTSDLRMIWDLDLYPDAQDPISENEASLRNDFPIDCTQMFWLSALQKFDPDVGLIGLLDRSGDAINRSRSIYANNLVIAAPEELGLGLCQKFLGSARISRTKGQCAQWQHIEWINAYRELCENKKGSFLASSELLALFLQRLIYVYPTRIETRLKLRKWNRAIDKLRQR